MPSDRGAAAGPLAWLRARLKGPGCVGALVVLAALAVLRLYGTNEILESRRLLAGSVSAGLPASEAEAVPVKNDS